MTKLHCDNHLIATRIELKDMEKYIYNMCSKKKNLILRKRTIKSIYCTGIYIVHVIASFGFNVNIVWTYFIERIKGLEKKSSNNLIVPLPNTFHR